MSIKYTYEMKEFLKEVVPNNPYKEVLILFNKKFNTNLSLNTLKSSLKRFKILNDGRFKKGNIPWNKGKKTGIVPPNTFKKGNIPWHTRPVGSERLDKDGYIIIKIANHKWVRKHRWIWEEINGEIPKDSVIIFADGNKKNLDIDNMICVTRNELKILNQCRLISSIPELTKVGLNVAKIKAKLYELRKESKK